MAEKRSTEPDTPMIVAAGDGIITVGACAHADWNIQRRRSSLEKVEADGIDNVPKADDIMTAQES